MGVSARAYAVIGVRLDIDSSSFGESREPSCGHVTSYPIDNAKFCPQCGKEVKVVKNRYHQFDSIYEITDALEKDLKTQFSNHNWVVAYSYDYEDVCVGIGTAASEYNTMHAMIKTPPNDEIKQMLKTVLEPFELYDEDEFGLHVVLYFG